MRRLAKVAPLIWLAACGGTDVGNALKAEVQMLGDSGTAPADFKSFAAGLLSPEFLTATPTLELFTLNVERLSFPLQTDCGSALPSAADWRRTQTGGTVDLLSTTALSLSLELPADSQTCQFRFLLGPGADGLSLHAQGTTAGGYAYEVRSSSRHLIALTSTTPVTLNAASGLALEGVFHLGNYREGAELDDGAFGAASTLVITPESRPVLFRRFLRAVRESFRSYRFQRDAAGAIVRDRAHNVAAGDDSQDSEAEGEASAP